MFTWISILTPHIAFRKACIAQSTPPSHLPYRAPFGVWGSSIALDFMNLLMVFKSAEVFVHGFDCKTFIVQYIGIPVYLVCIFSYKYVMRTRRVPKLGTCASPSQGDEKGTTGQLVQDWHDWLVRGRERRHLSRG
jgi:amino acid transporter